jgi:fibronectin type 3 domain-containing protein/TolB-like protein
MGKRFLAVIVFLMLICPSVAFTAPSQIRISVFNFGTVNLEASGLGATVTNQLINLLGEDASLKMLDRKELEAFLSMNDLQQNDQIDNVVNIGTRLGLNVIVVGSVEKKGSVIMVLCKAVQIGQKKAILSARVAAVGESGLAGEMRKLSLQVRSAITEQILQEKSTEGGAFGGPVEVTKRSGNRSVHLLWEAPSGAAVAGYEIFRAASEAGPFSKLSQVAKTEYVDETVEKDTSYYYKIRAYNDRGIQSEFSPVVEAKTAVTPNPPVILKTEGHVGSISLLWSPGPGGSGDPFRLKGYRLYRAKSEQGSYREVANLQTTNLGDATAALDRLLKVSYIDKGLGDGEDNYYRVTAYNEKNLESEFSRSVKGSTVPAVGAVAAEGDLIREIRLSWKPIDSTFIRGYHIYRSASEKEGFVRIKRVEAPSAVDRKIEYVDREGLADLTRYHYRITALEEAETETSPSPVASAATRGKPPLPEELKAVGGLVKKVELSWKASTAEEVEGYKLYGTKEKEGELPLLKTLPGRTTYRYTDNSRGYDKLEDGTTYRYRLTSYNRVGVESEAAPAVTARTKSRPEKVSGFQGESAKAKAVPLRWSPNPEKDIALYHLFRSGEGVDFERIAKPRETAYLDQGLKDNTSYRYRLQAEDKDGLLGDYSETISVRTKARPAKPEGANGGIAEGKAVLTWKEAAEPDVAHYTVYEKRLFGMDKIATVRERRFSEAAPPKGKVKIYLITVTDRDGLESDPGPEITITGQ